jgi:hypothetical protein
VVSTLESADGISNGSWEGKLAMLKSYFATSIANLEVSLKSLKNTQKDDIQSLQKTMIA